MKKVLRLLALGAAVALVASAPAGAYTRPTDPSAVAIVGCFSSGGTRAVPANTPITAFGGWAATNRGLVTDWLNASTNTLSIDGGAAIDLSPYFAGLTPDWTPPDWADIWFYSVGPLASGQSMTLVYTTEASHPTPDGTTHGPPGPGMPLTFTCTITAG